MCATRRSVLPRRFRGCCAILAGVSAALASGCGPKPEQLAAFLRAYEHDVSASSYRVAPPDAIEITSPQSPEIDNEVQTIQPDGKIALRLLGEVKVSGLTCGEIADKLRRQLSRYYVNPEVNVRVLTGASKRYYVFCEVGRAGPYAYTGNDSLIGALALAQPTFLAWKSQIKLIRPSHRENERHELVVDADRIIEEGRLENNILLQEGDILYVPPTPLAWVGLRLRELLFPVPGVGGAMNAPLDLRDSGVRYSLPSQPGAVVRTY